MQKNTVQFPYLVLFTALLGEPNKHGVNSSKVSDLVLIC